MESVAYFYLQLLSEFILINKYLAMHTAVGMAQAVA
jgi:hypothetical protein